MSTSLRNKLFKFLFLGALFFGLVPAGFALPIGQVVVLVSTDAAYTAGVSTANAVFVAVFTSTGGFPDTAETISLQLISGGTALNNAISPASFTTVPNTIVQNQSVIFYHAAATANHQLKATTASGITGTSASNREFIVNANTASKLIVLAPGETLNPGTNPALTTGKSGSASTQLVNQNFDVAVDLTDDQFNPVSGVPVVTMTSGANVTITGSPQALVAGQGTFQILMNAPKITRTLTASAGGLTSGTADITTAGPPTEEVFPFPSPFNPHTGSINFQYRLDSPKEVTIKVLDQFGQQVWENSAAGQINQLNIVTWDGKTKMGDFAAAGVYYAVLEVGGSVKSKKKFGVKK